MLAAWILEDRLPVRMQLQLHKILWGINPVSNQKAIVLLSGGLDSATVLAHAVSEGFHCHCLSFDYGQSHQAELAHARVLADSLGAASHRTAHLDLAVFGGSALTDENIEVPDADSGSERFLSLTFRKKHGLPRLCTSVG